MHFSRALGIEAYSLEGNARTFPDHFHSYYVIGFVAKGARLLRCAGRSCELGEGGVMLLNPGDSHGCTPNGGTAFDYIAFNISRAVMSKAARSLARGDEWTEPRFSVNVLRCGETAALAEKLYAAVAEHAPRAEQERAFMALLEKLLPRASAASSLEGGGEDDISMLRRHIEEHYAERLSLSALLSMTDLTKFSMIRAFSRKTGVTPYRYLQAVRLGRAMEFLRRGASPAEAADSAGFADQSHLTNYFRRFTGLTPKQYQKIFTE